MNRKKLHTMLYIHIAVLACNFLLFATAEVRSQHDTDSGQKAGKTVWYITVHQKNKFRWYDVHLWCSESVMGKQKKNHTLNFVVIQI